MRVLPFAVVLAVVALTPETHLANDAAASLGAGGIRLGTERRVTMAKERLFIGAPASEKPIWPGFIALVVRVEYEFVNDSKDDVSTEVAFPIPPLPYQGESLGPTSRFDTFKVWVDGREVSPHKTVRALLNGRDVTSILDSIGVPIETYGGFAHDDGQNYDVFEKLPPEKYDVLVREKLIEQGRLNWPLWDVAVTYHWPQSFPSGKTVKIRHEYRPSFGTEQPRVADLMTTHADGCFNAKAVDALERRGASGEARARDAAKNVMLVWVDYILTTANTWKTPIRDFELIVERPDDWRASFCWDGKVERVGKTQFRVKAKNFIPTRDLRVYFYPR